jgi:hypothetical protein
MPNGLIWIAILVIALLLFSVLTAFLQAFIEKNRKLEMQSKRLLSPAEAAFYKFLAQTVGSRYVINCKTPLDDVLKQPRGQRMSKPLFGMYKTGHIDFLVIHPLSTEPILAIELDDSTHLTAAAKDRDQRKDKLLAAANLPLMRVSPSTKWGEKEKQMINTVLAPDTATRMVSRAQSSASS